MEIEVIRISKVCGSYYCFRVSIWMDIYESFEIDIKGIVSFRGVLMEDMREEI